MRHFAALATLVILATGCGSTPPARFYTLGAVPGPAAGPSELSVAVGPVTVPAAVERPQIVVSTGPNQVRLDEFNQWAAPLSNNIARVVAENLVAMLGTPRVTISPQTLSAGVDYRAVIEVQRFDSALGEAATMDAVWTVTRTRDGKGRRAHDRARGNDGARFRRARGCAQPCAGPREPGHRGRGTGARSFRPVGGQQRPALPRDAAFRQVDAGRGRAAGCRRPVTRQGRHDGAGRTTVREPITGPDYDRPPPRTVERGSLEPQDMADAGGLSTGRDVARRRRRESSSSAQGAARVPTTRITRSRSSSPARSTRSRSPSTGRSSRRKTRRS